MVVGGQTPLSLDNAVKRSHYFVFVLALHAIAFLNELQCTGNHCVMFALKLFVSALPLIPYRCDIAIRVSVFDCVYMF